MGKIKIISDEGEVYAKGEIVDVHDLITSYCECCDNESKSIADYVCRIPIPSAVDFIAKAWGIEYEFV